MQFLFIILQYISVNKTVTIKDASKNNDRGTLKTHKNKSLCHNRYIVQIIFFPPLICKFLYMIFDTLAAR